MVWAITLGIVGGLLILMAVAFWVAERVLDAHERRMNDDPLIRMLREHHARRGRPGSRTKTAEKEAERAE